MRAIMRFLGFLAVVGGFVALVVDVTLFMANDVWQFASLQSVLNTLFPGAGMSLSAAAGDLAGSWPGAWASTAVATLLAAPASVTGIVGGFLLMLLFRNRNHDDANSLH